MLFSLYSDDFGASSEMLLMYIADHVFDKTLRPQVRDTVSAGGVKIAYSDTLYWDSLQRYDIHIAPTIDMVLSIYIPLDYEPLDCTYLTLSRSRSLSLSLSLIDSGVATNSKCPRQAHQVTRLKCRSADRVSERAGYPQAPAEARSRAQHHHLVAVDHQQARQPARALPQRQQAQHAADGVRLARAHGVARSFMQPLPGHSAGAVPAHDPAVPQHVLQPDRVDSGRVRQAQRLAAAQARAQPPYLHSNHHLAVLVPRVARYLVQSLGRATAIHSTIGRRSLSPRQSTPESPGNDRRLQSCSMSIYPFSLSLSLMDGNITNILTDLTCTPGAQS